MREPDALEWGRERWTHSKRNPSSTFWYLAGSSSIERFVLSASEISPRPSPWMISSSTAEKLSLVSRTLSTDW